MVRRWASSLTCTARPICLTKRWLPLRSSACTPLSSWTGVTSLSGRGAEQSQSTAPERRLPPPDGGGLARFSRPLRVSTTTLYALPPPPSALSAVAFSPARRGGGRCTSGCDGGLGGTHPLAGSGLAAGEPPWARGAARGDGDAARLAAAASAARLPELLLLPAVAVAVALAPPPVLALALVPVPVCCASALADGGLCHAGGGSAGGTGGGVAIRRPSSAAAVEAGGAWGGARGGARGGASEGAGAERKPVANSAAAAID